MFGIGKILCLFLSVTSNKCQNELELQEFKMFSQFSKTASQSISYFSMTAYKFYDKDHLELLKCYNLE